MRSDAWFPLTTLPPPPPSPSLTCAYSTWTIGPLICALFTWHGCGCLPPPLSSSPTPPTCAHSTWPSTSPHAIPQLPQCPIAAAAPRAAWPTPAADPSPAGVGVGVGRRHGMVGGIPATGNTHMEVARHQQSLPIRLQRGKRLSHLSHWSCCPFTHGYIDGLLTGWRGQSAPLIGPSPRMTCSLPPAPCPLPLHTCWMRCGYCKACSAWSLHSTGRSTRCGSWAT